MTECQRHTSDFFDGAWIIEQLAQNTCATFGCFVEQQDTPIFHIGQWFCGQFIVFQLIMYLDGTFQCCLQ
jgi:hypothetical protein